ncbi:MAG: tripartite tricarboxylate transporter substrate binding protein [Betaproteobacteria bacterium]|nr:tripartite tricarboxylate transporter substrate binding protein [Betaproteobacteria bacterium]
MIVPFTPGGSSDLTARVISQQLSEQLGKSFVVDNRPGATGTIGTGIVAKSAPDGYTLLLADTSTTMMPSLYKSLSFDVAQDFTPISQIIRSPQVYVVNPSLNVNTLKEFIALAQANPGKFSYASAGAGSSPHLMIELFKKAANVNIAHIPYKGSGPAMAAVLGGEVAMSTAGIATVLPYVNSGKVRALAITTDGKRSPLMPTVPSMGEAGLSGMTIYAWHGLVGPVGMRKEVVNKLHSEVVKAIAVPSMKERFIAQGGELVGSSPEELSKLIRADLQRWAEVVKSAGITLE